MLSCAEGQVGPYSPGKTKELTDAEGSQSLKNVHTL